MKLIISLIFITIVSLTTYYFSSKTTARNKRQKHKKNNNKPIIITTSVTILLLMLLAFLMYRDTVALDSQCNRYHTTTTQAPAKLETALDYFEQGNYDYDTGDCLKAINDYTVSILLDPNYPQVYNNRAYTFMRLRNYESALPDLDKALELNPNYIQALMNRGDIHNYYYNINRPMAIADYNKVILLGATKGSSVCGHRAMAESKGFLPGAFLRIFANFNCQ